MWSVRPSSCVESPLLHHVSRCSSYGPAQWLGDSQGFDFASSRKAHCQSTLVLSPAGMSINQLVGRNGTHPRILWPGGRSSVMYRYVKHSAITRIRIRIVIGLATVANMGAEVGATTSTFPYTENMRAYLHATGRGPAARAADEAAEKGFLSPDEGVEYDEVIEIVRAIMAITFPSPESSRSRTCRIWSPRSMAHSPLTWRHLYRSSEPLSRRMVGKTSFLPV